LWFACTVVCSFCAANYKSLLNETGFYIWDFRKIFTFSKNKEILRCGELSESRLVLNILQIQN
jgi:hypothetical protein